MFRFRPVVDLGVIVKAIIGWSWAGEICFRSIDLCCSFCQTAVGGRDNNITSGFLKNKQHHMVEVGSYISLLMSIFGATDIFST